VSYALSTTVRRPFPEVLDQVRGALAAQGFGVLHETDLQAVLKDKLDADIAPQVVLGACRPSLALAALWAEPSIAVLLPCNVAVRQKDAASTVVEAVDPLTIVETSGSAALQDLAEDAIVRLRAALTSLGGTPVSP
jgi:uncharacterized protein (DUF302 family)